MQRFCWVKGTQPACASAPLGALEQSAFFVQ